jgi:hypothetical protein
MSDHGTVWGNMHYFSQCEDGDCPEVRYISVYMTLQYGIVILARMIDMRF